ncbi:hypothetical protein CC78DRAFT_122036 [Lojkania enalia]|uniref:Uncharacterized protein n=1 Tax=Lojkania enalia TaxID=147567 RepID=A0A9P4KEY8_9PLEO|nr:hypothetical protein CC78DRAFT_122036 [Didymosphaeria enalia]
MHLHDSTLYSTPDPNGPNGSPVKLQIWTMLQQSTRHLCTPIGPATLRIPITNTNGEKEKVLQSLESRMTEFETLYKSEVKELQALHAQWETVVGEIWKCGVQFLGEEKMREMLMPSTQNHTGDKEQAKELVVAGDGDQDAGAKGKKKVAFRDPLPRILTQPSAFQRSVQPLPDVPGDEVQKLEDMIDGLGAKQIEEFRKLDKEEKKWWRRKEGRIAAAFQDE